MLVLASCLQKKLFAAPEIPFLDDKLFVMQIRNKVNIVFYQKKWIKIFLFFLIWFPGYVTANEPTTQFENYTIGMGDLLSITVWAGEYLEEDMKGEYLVLDSGVIEMPLVGDIEIGGKTEEQATNQIIIELKQYIRKPIVQLKVQSFNSQKVSVVGAVQRPGVIQIKGSLTLLQALAEKQLTRKKQGSGAWAAQKVFLTRKDQTSSTIDLEALLTLGKGNVLLRDGDNIFVSDGAYVYVNGKVSKPGPVPFRKGMTVSEALAEAGGEEKGANLRGVYIFRDGQRLKINVHKIRQGKEEDRDLKEGDTLFVEESIW